MNIIDKIDMYLSENVEENSLINHLLKHPELERSHIRDPQVYNKNYVSVFVHPGNSLKKYIHNAINNSGHQVIGKIAKTDHGDSHEYEMKVKKL